MFCNHCGREIPDNSQFCNNCGANLAAANPAGPYPVVPPPGPTETVPTSGKATASLILGILGLTIFSILTAIPAIILGHSSRKEIKASGGRLKGEGLALAGLIMGWISTGLVIVIVPILIIAAIAIPNLLRSRMAANESTAVGAVRTINTAAVSYAATNNQFPESLDELERAGLIDDSIAKGNKSGYNFYYEASDSDGDGTRDKYWVVASPVTRGTTGSAEFCSDETGMLRKDESSCTPESVNID
jgi:type IV pilus assembly protein PilA